MSSNNPIKYTSRDFESIMADINNDPELADKPDWWKRIWAGVGDMLSMNQDVIANLGFLGSAFVLQAVRDHCANIDYDLSPHSTSTGDLLFYLNADSVSFPITFDKKELKAKSEGSVSISSKQFESRSGLTIQEVTNNFTADESTDILTVSRVFTTGEKVRISSNGTLSAPFQVNTDYYVIYLNDTQIKIAESIRNAFSGTAIDITDTGTGTHTMTLYSFKVSAYQQESIESAISVGSSDGTEWQEFDLPDTYILKDTLEIEINSEPWTIVDILIYSYSTDKHAKLLYQDEGNSKLLFSNGEYGAIPGMFDIYVTYAKGGGIDSNVSNLNKINIYAGSSEYIVGVTNCSTFTGGADEESLSSAKYLAPLLLKTRDSFITILDGGSLSKSFDGVGQVVINRNVYGLFSAQVVIVPNGGGTPSTELKTNLKEYLIQRSVFGSADVRVIDPVYISTSIVAQIKLVDEGYTFSTVQAFVVLALRLMFTEVGQELLEVYEGNGVSKTVEFINNKWSTTFTNSDYTQIQRLMDNLDPTEFGKEFQNSDVLSYVDSYVYGVKYWTITSPSFPITLLSFQITQDNISPSNITEIT